MPINDNDVTWIEEPELSFWELTFLPGIIDGLKTTFSHLTSGRPVTREFPDVEPELPAHYRGVHRLNRDEQNRVKCVACMLCETACPADCIKIEAADAPPEWPDRDKYPASFELDELRCIYCGMCEEACPVDAIELTHVYDITSYNRQDMIYNKDKLLDIYEQTKDHPMDPVRTKRGRLGAASEFDSLPTVGPATWVEADDRSAVGIPCGIIGPMPRQQELVSRAGEEHVEV